MPTNYAQQQFNAQQRSRAQQGRQAALHGMKGSGLNKPVSNYNYGSGPSIPTPGAGGRPGYGMSTGGGYMPAEQWGQDGGYIPNFGGPDPTFNFDPTMMGGSTTIDKLGSRTNPNILPFYSEVLGYKSRESANQRAAWEAMLRNKLEGRTEDRNLMVAQAQYGQGGLAWEQSKLARDTLAQQASEGAFGREHATELQAGSLASQERVAGLPYEHQMRLMQTPLAQQIFGLSGGGENFDPGGGLAEQEFMRRDLAAGGRRAADEASYLKGELESSTGPGGGGMAGGPGGTVAANRAMMMRLQARAGERQSYRQQMIDRDLARRGQNMSFAGQMFG